MPAIIYWRKSWSDIRIWGVGTKIKIVILIIALVIIAAMCWLGYLHYASAAVKAVLYNTDVTSDKDKEHLYRIPEHTELGNDAESGCTIHFRDYSLIICGYENAAAAEDSNNVYLIGNNKVIINVNLLKCDNLYNDNSAVSSWVKKAAGRKINNDYELFEARFYCTPDDFTLFDVDKNKGVTILLDSKYFLMPGACYQFDNGVIKGFIHVIVPPDEENSDGTFVTFSDCEDPGSIYQLVFSGFSIEEIKEMLSTIEFDGSNANQ